jgi:ferredoxin-NADP reductase
VWRKYSIVEKKTLTPRITSFILTTNTPLTESDKLEEGTHATIRLSNGLVRSYSIVSGTKSTFELGIALDEHSRGGSRFLHESTSTGSSIEVSGFSDPMPVATAAAHHLFIVGGVGITAFLPIFEAMHAIHFSFSVHWAVRSEADAPFQDRLAPFRHCVALYSKEKGQRLDVPAVLERRPWGTHVYVCGPDRLVDGVQGAVKSAGMEDDDVHYELFKVDASGDPFEVLVKNREGRVVQVECEESLLEALRRVFDGVESSCEVGNCGTCRITVVEGRVEHRGVGLPEGEKEEAMLSCVSRGVGRIVVEI